MRSPRFHVTVRWIMILVAMMALALAAVAINQRARSYRRIANQHESDAFGHLDTVNMILQFKNGKRPQGEPCPLDPDHPNKSLDEMADDERRCADYHALLVNKYSLAARYPWLHVEPDSPSPGCCHALDSFPLEGMD